MPWVSWPRGRRQLRECLEPLRLRLRVVGERRRPGANPRVVLLDALVRTESVVVVGRVGRRPAERRDRRSADPCRETGCSRSARSTPAGSCCPRRRSCCGRRHSGRIAELQRDWRVVDDVADVVRGPAENRLGAQARVRGVDAPVAHDADVVDAAVAFDEVIAGDVDVIVVDVDRHRPVSCGLDRERRASKS